MKIALDINQQQALFAALNTMDEFDVIVPETPPRVIKQKYKLGPARRALVYNLRALQVSLAAFDEVRLALVKEFWPSIKAGQTIHQSDDPETFARYQPALAEVLATKDEIDLNPFPDSAIYNVNDFDTEVLALLEEFGLIETAAGAAD